MLIELSNPPSFITLNPETGALSTGVRVTPHVRSVTRLQRKAGTAEELPPDFETIVEGSVIPSYSGWIEISLRRPKRPITEPWVWVSGSDHFVSARYSPWTSVDLSVTTAEGIMHACGYGERPPDRAPWRAIGAPKQVTERFSLVKREAGAGKVRLEAIETDSIRKSLLAASQKAAREFLEKIDRP